MAGRAGQGELTFGAAGPPISPRWLPLIGPGQSDTACIDNALELLVIGGGYSLAATR